MYAPPAAHTPLNSVRGVLNLVRQIISVEDLAVAGPAPVCPGLEILNYLRRDDGDQFMGSIAGLF